MACAIFTPPTSALTGHGAGVGCGHESILSDISMDGGAFRISS